LRVPEIAKREKVSEQTVGNWIHKGLLRTSIDSIGFFIDPADLEDFLEKHSSTSYIFRRRNQETIFSPSKDEKLG
jgi:predicted site-specific integrase-resolvase